MTPEELQLWRARWAGRLRIRDRRGVDSRIDDLIDQAAAALELRKRVDALEASRDTAGEKNAAGDGSAMADSIDLRAKVRQLESLNESQKSLIRRFQDEAHELKSENDALWALVAQHDIKIDAKSAKPEFFIKWLDMLRAMDSAGIGKNSPDKTE